MDKAIREWYRKFEETGLLVCLSYRRIVTITFCNRTELLPIFIWKFAVTSLPLYLSV
jgi:hypothetical protein